MSLILVNWQLWCNLHDWGSDTGWGLLGMGVGALGCVCIYSPLVSWFISRKKFACGNNSVPGRSCWLQSSCQPCTHPFVFTLGISVLCVSKDVHESFSRWSGGVETNLLWLVVGYQWKKSVWLPPPIHISCALFCCLGSLSPLQEALWVCVRQALQTPLMKISLVNKQLGAWRTLCFPSSSHDGECNSQVTEQWPKPF